WTLFPEQAIDSRKDIRIAGTKRWPTKITPEQFRQVTGHTRAQDLDYYCNTQVEYELRGIPVKMDVLWRYEAPPGTGDTHLALFRGANSSVEIRQGEAEKYRPERYVVPGEAAVRAAVHKRIDDLQ